MPKLSLLLYFYISVVAAQNTASIQGSVTDATTGKAISGAVVTAIRSGLSPLSRPTVSTPAGAFQIPSLPAGPYSLCVQMPDDSYPASCDWGASPVRLTLATGQQSTGNALQLRPGTLLRVSLQDPNQFLQQKTAAGFAPGLFLGVQDATLRFHPAHIAGKTRTASTYQIAVPVEAALRLHIRSRNLQLADANGSALPANAAQQVLTLHAAGPNVTSFSFTVTGLLP